MSSGSSSEESERLREAVDPGHCRLFAKEKSPQKIERASRRARESPDRNSELKVSPGLQKYVAKHLDQLIERSVKFSKKKRPHRAANSPESGIHLFSTSGEMVTIEEEGPRVLKNKKARKKSTDSEDEDRLREAAVSADWVLDKKGAY